MKRIKQDISGQGSMLTFFVGAMIAVIIALQVAWPVIDTAIYGTGSYATNTLTMTNNMTCGQWVNFTFPDGTYVNYQANITLGLVGCTLGGGATAIPLTAYPGNNSNNSVASFATALNDDDSGNISGRLVATNTSDSKLVVRYNKVGTIGNGVGTTEGLTYGSWASTTLLGGVYGGLSDMSTSAQTLVEQIPLFLVLVLLMIFVKAVI